MVQITKFSQLDFFKPWKFTCKSGVKTYSIAAQLLIQLVPFYLSLEEPPLWQLFLTQTPGVKPSLTHKVFR